MGMLNDFLDNIRAMVRKFMHQIAINLNSLSGGKISPNSITLIGLTMHVPIAILIATRHNLWAAGLLLVFGLFDTLDGELARLQKKASPAGMLLDASTDRIKEVLLYTGAAYSVAALGSPQMAFWAVGACGASLCVSYVKAKGETAVKSLNLTANQINRLFSGGLFRYEIRMFVLLVGLLSGRVIIALIIITIGSTFTTFSRLINITNVLNKSDEN